MVYNNFLLRILFSFLLIIVYLILFINFSDKIIYFVSLLYLIIFIEVFLYFQKFKNIIFAYLIFSYFFLLIYFNNNFNPYEFTVIILCISCFDSCCYLFGKTFGKNKIFQKISPNKTYEGLVGGILITNIVSMFAYFNFDVTNFFVNYNFIIFTNLVIFFSFFGDLIQSYFKRLNNLDDSSNFIPGHGGFFDRFDSFLLVIIPFSLINFLY